MGLAQTFYAGLPSNVKCGSESTMRRVRSSGSACSSLLFSNVGHRVSTCPSEQSNRIVANIGFSVPVSGVPLGSVARRSVVSSLSFHE